MSFLGASRETGAGCCLFFVPKTSLGSSVNLFLRWHVVIPAALPPLRCCCVVVRYFVVSRGCSRGRAEVVNQMLNVLYQLAMR